MHLDVGGHPLHSRALSVTLVARADGRLDVHGVILDLRKRGFVPVGGDLQPSGIVHHMMLDGIVDPATARLDALTASQPAVAFEPSAVTQGESCRDPIARVGGLVGGTLDASWARALSTEIGGPRGCSHLLTLAQLLGSTVAWALARDEARFGKAPDRRPGERVFRRDVVVDGHELSPGAMALAFQLADLHYAPAPPLAPSMDRFAEEREVRGIAEVDFATFSLAGLRLGERVRDRATLDTATWSERPDLGETVRGLSLARGVTAALLERLGGVDADRPILDAVLMLAPALIQCVAALSDTWPSLAASGAWIVGMGGRPDSCYMWRAGGALQLARRANEPPTA
ncbi:MAG TPA: DUF2889 domain-containing protein [Candidatus Eisenbacteria bacterium]|nr:DUF2889 domain-containing protein [Candidatus Eisenbacteria bacterium]